MCFYIFIDINTLLTEVLFLQILFIVEVVKHLLGVLRREQFSVPPPCPVCCAIPSLFFFFCLFLGTVALFHCNSLNLLL